MSEEPSGRRSAWFTCTRCGRHSAGAPVITVTGRQLCADCDRSSWGLTAGAGQGNNAADKEMVTFQLGRALRDAVFRRHR